MICGCFSLVKGLPSLFKNVVELGPKFQPATLGFVQTLVLRNVFYRFDKVVWLFDDFELGSRFGVSDFIGVNLNQEKEMLSSVCLLSHSMALACSSRAEATTHTTTDASSPDA